MSTNPENVAWIKETVMEDCHVTFKRKCLEDISTIQCLQNFLQRYGMEEGQLLKGAQAVGTRNEKQQGEIQQIKKLGDDFYRYDR